MTKVDFDPACKMHRAFLATDIRVALLGLGFKPAPARPGCNEVVFEKPSTRLQGVTMKVYTTIVGDEVRSLGKDSIKVCAVYAAADGRVRGLAKERRVHRTGDMFGISGRIVERIKLAAADINSCPACESCGAPKFTSKRGNMVCAEICWAK